jgi:hypothetical protein
MSAQTERLLTAAIRCLAALLIAISLALAGWALKTTSDNRVTIAKNEAKAFTDDQGIEVWKKIGEIDKEVALSAQAGREIVGRLDRMDQTIRREFDNLTRDIKNHDTLRDDRGTSP